MNKSFAGQAELLHASFTAAGRTPAAPSRARAPAVTGSVGDARGDPRTASRCALTLMRATGRYRPPLKAAIKLSHCRNGTCTREAGASEGRAADRCACLSGGIGLHMACMARSWNGYSYPTSCIRRHADRNIAVLARSIVRRRLRERLITFYMTKRPLGPYHVHYEKTNTHNELKRSTRAAVKRLHRSAPRRWERMELPASCLFGFTRHLLDIR